MSFIEVTAMYLQEDDGTDYEGLDMDLPDDYPFDCEPTLIAVDEIAKINPIDDGKNTMLHLGGDGGAVKAAEPYDTIKKRIEAVRSQICSIGEESENYKLDSDSWIEAGIEG